MSGPEITTVTLPCIRDGGSVYLQLLNPRRRIEFELDRITEPVEHDIINLKISLEERRGPSKDAWFKACIEFRKRLKSNTRYASLDGWERWASFRAASTRKRRSPSPQGNKKQFAKELRHDWEAAFKLMSQQLLASVMRRSFRGWKQWSYSITTNANRRWKGMTKKIKAAELRALVESQGYRCALTGVDLMPETASADHIQPISDGGKNEIENIQILHHKVNAAKGTMPNDEFIQMCKNVVNWLTNRPTSRVPLENQKVLF